MLRRCFEFHRGLSLLEAILISCSANMALLTTVPRCEPMPNGVPELKSKLNANSPPSSRVTCSVTESTAGCRNPVTLTGTEPFRLWTAGSN